jgi:hypothetical protein
MLMPLPHLSADAQLDQQEKVFGHAVSTPVATAFHAE